MKASEFIKHLNKVIKEEGDYEMCIAPEGLIRNDLDFLSVTVKLNGTAAKRVIVVLSHDQRQRMIANLSAKGAKWDSVELGEH